MAVSEKLHAKIQFYVQKLEQFADRSWYPLLVGLLSVLDNLIIIIPIDGILVASSMLVPKRWAMLVLCITVGSTLGAVLLSLIVENQGLPWVLDFFPEIDKAQVWIWTEKIFNEYGLFLVFAVAVSPLAQQPVIILSALGNTPIGEIAAVIFAGRLIKSFLLAYIGRHSPRLLKKLWGIKGELKDAGIKIEEQ
jgi:membrane protein YqaA with SNARE-associated domain